MATIKNFLMPALARTDIPGYCRAYYQLTKPKVVALLVLTAWVGMMLATPAPPDLLLVLLASLGIALVSAAAAAFNHVLDQKIDAQMARTYMRPLPKGKLSTLQAVAFACALAISGFMILLLAVNALTALLTLLGLFGYAVVYTLLLKRATPQNIVIGRHIFGRWRFTAVMIMPKPIFLCCRLPMGLNLPKRLFCFIPFYCFSYVCCLIWWA